MIAKFFFFAIVIALVECQSKIFQGTAITSLNSVYTVSIQNEHKHICTGAPITNKNKYFVITAASCIAGFTAESLEVRINSLYYDSGRDIHYVTKITCQGAYNPNGNENDYAVLEIDGKTNINVVLPTANTMPTSFTVYGWGSVTGNNIMSSQLMKKSVDIMDNGECKEILGTSMVGNGVMCTQTAACNGDAGGPLLSGKNLYGIISWNRNCLDQPTVYTNVWDIKEYLLERCLV